MPGWARVRFCWVWRCPLVRCSARRMPLPGVEARRACVICGPCCCVAAQAAGRWCSVSARVMRPDVLCLAFIRSGCACSQHQGCCGWCCFVLPATFASAIIRHSCDAHAVSHAADEGCETPRQTPLFTYIHRVTQHAACMPMTGGVRCSCFFPLAMWIGLRSCHGNAAILTTRCSMCLQGLGRARLLCSGSGRQHDKNL